MLVKKSFCEAWHRSVLHVGRGPEPHQTQESAPAMGFRATCTLTIHPGSLFPSISLQHPPVWLHHCLSSSWKEALDQEV